MTNRLGCLVAALLLSNAAFADPMPTLLRLDGQREYVAIRSIDAQWLVGVENETGNRSTIPGNQFVTWGGRRDTQRRSMLLLADGGVLAVDEWFVSASQIHLPAGGRSIWNDVRLPRPLVRGIVLQPPSLASQRDALQRRIQSHRSTQDQLWLDNQDVLTGALLPREPPADGKTEFGPLRLRTKNGEVEIAEERVQAIVFAAVLGAPERPRRLHALLGFRDGSALVCHRVETKQGTTSVTLLEDQIFGTDTESFFETLVSVQTFGPHLTYLSDLSPPPNGYKHIPYLAQTWPLAVDHSVSGGWLRHGGQLVTKGLGMHSASRLAYDLDGQYAQFQAELAIDDHAQKKGSVVFRVFLDRADEGLKPVYESPIVRGGDAALPISLNVANANRMVLIVEFADRGDELDHANWLNARLLRP